ncbi:MAG: class I SAM-dependent methyltransferase [Bacteroidetes bacterium]|nr:class I SAM-dependent methyltransferase [Bacteroidota bacterium]
MSTKTIQGKLWSVAPIYWSQHFEPWFMPMYSKVLDQLRLNEDQLMLDAGCGSGLFSYLAINTGAEVIGVDAAPGLLEVARRRNPKNNFLEEDLEALPFTENRFDVVTGFNSFQYAGNFQSALAEAKRVLKPGGRLVIAIWDKPEMSDATHVLKSIGSLLPPPPPGTPGPFALSEDGKMESILAHTGLELTYKMKVACPFLYRSLTDGIKSFMGTGPAAAAMNTNSQQTVEAVITKALESFRLPDDFYFLQNSFLVFFAEK